MAKLTRRTAVVELADERILTVRITNPDTLRCEETARRHKWPGPTVVEGVGHMDGMALRGTFEAWAALTRTGQYDGPFEQFRKRDCLDLTIDEETVDPTQPGPESDSSPSSPGTDDEVSRSFDELMTS